MTHYGYLRALINTNAMPTNKEITLALDEQDARIAELEEIITEAREQCLQRDAGTAYMTLLGANIEPKENEG